LDILYIGTEIDKIVDPVLNFAANAGKVYHGLKPETKRQFLGFLLSNFKVGGKNTGIPLKNPYNYLVQEQNRIFWWR